MGGSGEGDLSDILGRAIRAEPLNFLFHCTNETTDQNGMSITPYMLTACKSLIPFYWGKRLIPTIPQCLRRVDELRLMEEITCRNKGLTRKYLETWAKWFEFKNNKLYYEIISDFNTRLDYHLLNNTN